MANKKRKGGNKKPKSAPQKKAGPQGGQKSPQKSPQKLPQITPEEAGGPANHPETKDPGPTKDRPAQRPGQAKQGQKKTTGSARRAAQRRAARRKRQMLTVGGGAGVVVLAVILLIAINGGPQGKGKISSPGDVKISSGPRDTLIPDGQKLPTFSAPGLDGGTISSAAGQPSVLAIWASWCPVCQEEMPSVNKVKEGYPGVEVASIVTSQGQEPGPTPEQFVADKKITIPVAVDDASGDLRRGMGVTSFPVLYFVNADGTVFKSHLGLLDEATLNSYFETLQQQADPGSPTPEPTPKPD